ncbi:hypothetical protein [Emticicia soli]|uniref:Uncharacterized protein n=1 Tax=Emticicia soli TaxID=2027878 RepID=A0ABW5JCV7_9BACT
MKNKIIVFLILTIQIIGCKCEEPLKEIKTEVALGKGAVYYGVSNSDILKKVGEFKLVIIEPGHISSTSAPANAIPYVSLTGVNQNNESLRKLSQDIANVDGFLKKNGVIVNDHNGPGTYLVDLRKPKAFSIMKDFMVAQAKSYKAGIFLDAIDSATWQENNNPEFLGLIDASVNLMIEVSTEVHKMASKQVVVNGGLFQRIKNTDKDIFESIASVADWITTEAQYYNTDYSVRPASDNTWTNARLSRAANIFAANNKVMRLLMLEPCRAGQHAAAAMAAKTFFQTFLQEIGKNAKCSIEAYIYVSPSYTNAIDLTGNINLLDK